MGRPVDETATTEEEITMKKTTVVKLTREAPKAVLTQ
jgi:hypothetical protein